jgi:hypothetical protein
MPLVNSDEDEVRPGLTERHVALGYRLLGAQPLAVAVGRAQHTPPGDHRLGAAVTLAPPVQDAPQGLHLTADADPRA